MSEYEKKNQGGEKKLLDPEKNVINISLKKSVRKYVFIAKLILKKFGNVELHSLGRATENVVRISEQLKRNGYAKEDKIESYITTLSDKYKQSGTRSELAFRVIMSKSDKFDELTKDLK